jgi:hypothetical protein
MKAAGPATSIEQSNNLEPKTMPIANPYPLPERVPFRQGTPDEHGRPTGQGGKIAFHSESEAEHRLWKLCTQAASPRSEKSELVVFVALGLLAAAALTSCFSELLHLLDADAIGKTVQALLTR